MIVRQADQWETRVMETAAYEVEAEVERNHWWFVGRRTLFAKEIAALQVPRDARVLDIGTSTGTNLRMLAGLGFHRFMGLDASEEAIRFCAMKGLGHVEHGDIRRLPFAEGTLDLVLATDVVEHVSEDADALREIARVLVPGGNLLLTVPAFPSLWGLQDEVAHHFRRYRIGPLRGALTAAGLRPVRAYYFNYLLFAPIWLARQALRLGRVRLASEGQVNTPLLNQLLTAIFSLDVATAPRLRPPFGVSILAVAQKAG
jgi:SAM-dependent methyltransferase